MADFGVIEGSEHSLYSFFRRTKAIIDEAELFIISEHLFFDNIDGIERIHERLSDAGYTVFTLKQRAFNLIYDFDIASFYNVCTLL